MTSRLRERRRANARTPGILRTPGTTPEAVERPVGHSRCVPWEVPEFE